MSNPTPDSALRPTRGLAKRIVLSLWLFAQLAVLGYLTWLSEVKGVRDHHLGLLLIPTFGVLLFPGVQLVFGAVAGTFWLAEAVGTPIVIGSVWLGLALSVGVWMTSAYITYWVWSWSVPRAWAAFAGWSTRHGERTGPETNQ